MEVGLPRALLGRPFECFVVGAILTEDLAESFFRARPPDDPRVDALTEIVIAFQYGKY